MHEPRRRFALSGQHFSAPAERGTRTAQACSSLTGGEFFAEIQRGVALCEAREIAAGAAGTAPYPRRWAKRKGHLRFPFLFELLPFPCFLIWRRFPICDRFENRERQRIFSTVGEHSVLPCRDIFAVPDTVLLHRRFTLRRARHSNAARFVSALLQTGSTRINCTKCLIRRCRALQRAKELRNTGMLRLR